MIYQTAILFAACFVLGSSVVSAQEAKSNNPATAYKEAFKAFPKLSVVQVRDDQVVSQGAAILKQWRDVPLDTAVSELINGYSGSLDKLYEAMTMKGECDWGVDLESGGINVSMPQAGPSVVLAKIALLRARQHVADRQSVKAASDILAVRRMARDMAKPECIVTGGIAYSIEQMALDALEDLQDNLSRTTRLRLANAFQQLPPLTEPHTVVDKERVYYRWMNAELKKAQEEGRAVIVLKQIYKGLGITSLKYNTLQAMEKTWRKDVARCDELQRELVDHVANCRGKPSRELAAFERKRNEWPLMARLMVPQCRNLIVKHDELLAKARELEKSLRR